MNKALGISQVSVEKDLAPGRGDLFRAKRATGGNRVVSGVYLPST